MAKVSDVSSVCKVYRGVGEIHRTGIEQIHCVTGVSRDGREAWNKLKTQPQVHAQRLLPSSTDLEGPLARLTRRTFSSLGNGTF